MNWLTKKRLRLFPKDSILIPKSGASVNLNHRAKLAIDAYVVSHLAVVTPDRSRIDPNYLLRFVLTRRECRRLGHSPAVRHRNTMTVFS